MYNLILLYESQQSRLLLVRNGWPLLETHDALQRTNTENLKQILPEKELRGQSPYFHIHVFWAIYIFTRSICLFCCRKYVDRSWEYKNRSHGIFIAVWGQKEKSTAQQLFNTWIWRESTVLQKDHEKRKGAKLFWRSSFQKVYNRRFLNLQFFKPE